MGEQFNRKDFLKLSGFAGAGFLTGRREERDPRSRFIRNRVQRFNMHGYAAPALDTVRCGLIGLGNRGSSIIPRLNSIEGVEITALCDLEPSRIERTRKRIEEFDSFPHSPEMYSGGPEEWKRMCDREDLDLVIVCTPWHLHAPMSIYAMEQGKHVATEIPAAKTIEECWQLVETSERTRRHCLQMTNVCYGLFEMITLNMAREGFFGEIIHGEGAYIHQLLDGNFSKEKYHDMWRLRENSSRNGNLYPHHGLGTVAQIMDINHGDQMEYMVSVSSNDFMMGETARDLARSDSFYEPFVDRPYRGNMNTTVIRTHQGRTIMLQHDVTSPRPYSRIHLVSGTKAVAQAFPKQVATSHDGWMPEEELNELEERFTPEITRKVGEMALRVGGHGGADTFLMWRLIDCLRNGLPLDLTVYDAALWSAVGPLSEWSVANGSAPIDIPDFTAGAWKSNPQLMDINLENGGSTQII